MALQLLVQPQRLLLFKVFVEETLPRSDRLPSVVAVVVYTLKAQVFPVVLVVEPVGSKTAQVAVELELLVKVLQVETPRVVAHVHSPVVVVAVEPQAQVKQAATV
jgi:hypothetical protein